MTAYICISIYLDGRVDRGALHVSPHCAVRPCDSGQLAVAAEQRSRGAGAPRALFGHGLPRLDLRPVRVPGRRLQNSNELL